MKNSVKKIAMNYQVLPGIYKDLQRDLRNEMAGFLIGCMLSVDRELWLYIGDFCPATDYTSTHTGVRINPKSFLDLDKRLAHYKRNYICVGWYHSHPFNSDFVQPSHVDVQTIFQSFSDFYHVSLIVDPISNNMDIWKVRDGNIISVKEMVSLVALKGNEYVKRWKL
ncbi:MAG: Mov34/MPN/PAD-1 family protein [Theionarchaea archaeon]|nr:Mov34/MPN/PAD-1 family protein [Theionarchaea archaeon]